MDETALYIVVLVIAAALRYMLGLGQACLYVGKAIVDTDTKTGLQDAVTPPLSTNIALATWAAAAGVIGYGFWQFGMATGALVVGEFIFAAGVLGATVMPKPDSKHYVRMIYRSLVGRVADYAKVNDHMRSEATAVLVARIENRLADKLF